MTLPALTICALYKKRGQVELFFKWIEQHLRSKRFMGTSKSAVRTHMWIAVTTYVLIAILKKKIESEVPLYTLLPIFPVSVYRNIELQRAFAKIEGKTTIDGDFKSLLPFDF